MKTKNIKKKTWLNLNEKELKNLETKSACMYGGKSKNGTF